MAILNEKNSLILIIDIQEKLINASYNKSLIEKNSVILANAAKILHIPVVVTEQYPKGLGTTIQGIKDALTDSATYIEKTSFSAIENSTIASLIDKSGRKQIIVFGIETHICVSQTVTALKTKGYDVTVISDASGSRAEVQHSAGLDRIKENGAHIITTEIALFEWLKSARHIKFKEVQSLIK